VFLASLTSWVLLYSFFFLSKIHTPFSYGLPAENPILLHIVWLPRPFLELSMEATTLALYLPAKPTPYG
jgi:hypothetical protein